jgi:hypothetical protein
MKQMAHKEALQRQQQEEFTRDSQAWKISSPAALEAKRNFAIVSASKLEAVVRRNQMLSKVVRTSDERW